MLELSDGDPVLDEKVGQAAHVGGPDQEVGSQGHTADHVSFTWVNNIKLQRGRINDLECHNNIQYWKSI